MTLELINALGTLRREQKFYEQSEELLTEALDRRQSKFDSNHPRTLESFHELGVLYKKQGDYAKAE